MAADPFAARLAELDAPAEDEERPEWLTPGSKGAAAADPFAARLSELDRSEPAPEAGVPAGKFRTRSGKLVDNPTAGEIETGIAAGKKKAEETFQRDITPQKGEGFFKRAFKSIAHGGDALSKVAGDVIETKGASLAEPAKRRQALRGLDDVVTLGYGQKLAARAGNALGDAPEAALGPETFGIQSAKADSFADTFAKAGAGPLDAAAMLGKAALLSSGGDDVANTQDKDQEVAPEYRTATQLVGGFVPGAGQLAARAGGKLIGKVPGLSAGGPVTGAAAGIVKGVAGYEATAPVTAALSAGAEGRRLEAAHEAATDPLGLIMAGAGGATGESLKVATEKSKGAKARELIEREGQGAKVTPFSPGKGGVFDDQLKGLPANDRGIGAAAKRGAVEIADTIEQQFKDEHGFDYREGPKVLKKAASEAKRQAQAARKAARAAEIAYRDDLAAAKNAVKTETVERARKILDDIEHEHRTETSNPYRKLKNEIDASEAAVAMRDVKPIVESMRAAVDDLETAPNVRGALEQQLKILDKYRTKQFDPEAVVEGGALDGMKAKDAIALLEKQSQRNANPAIAEEIQRIRDVASTDSGPIMLPERQLNGLRRTLMRSAKVGMSDVAGEAEAPLRRAAFTAKKMVDEGPYKALNELYATGSAKREAARKAVGLPGKPSKSAAADEKRLINNLRKSVTDETALPGRRREAPVRDDAVPGFIEGEEGTVRIPSETMGDVVHGPGAGPASSRPSRRADLPPEADMAAVRAALKAPKKRRDAEMARIRADLEAAEKKHAATAEKVEKAAKGAEEDRALLGLNTKIGTRKTDVNQIRLALQRQGENTGTGGGSAGSADVIKDFVAKHPEARTASMLPELQRAKSDLSFHIIPGHGGLHARGGAEALTPWLAALHAAKHPISTAAALAAVNRAPIAGRILAPLAKKVDTANLGARIGATGGAAQSDDDIAAARDIQKLVGIGMPTKDAAAVVQSVKKLATKLSDAEEARYQQWRASLPKELQYEGDYDLRGFYKKFPDFTAAPGQHMTDEFKLPNHPTFSDESRFYNAKTAPLGGHWEGDVFIPNDTRFKQRVDESPAAAAAP